MYKIIDRILSFNNKHKKFLSNAEYESMVKQEVISQTSREEKSRNPNDEVCGFLINWLI